MAGNWRHTPGKHGVPKVSTPKAKKPKAPKPYNPLTGSMHSLEYLQNQSMGQARADTNAALAALPSAKDIQGGAQALAALLSANQARQASLASSASPAFGSAFKQASAPSAAASIGAGGQAPTVNTGAQGLVGAMGANLAGALGSGINAATLEGQRQVGALLGQRKAVAAGNQSLYDKYLAQAKQDALQNAQIRENNYLSASGLGLKQSQIDATIRGQDVNAGQRAADRKERAREANARIHQQALDRAARILVSAGSKHKGRNDSLVNSSQSIIDRYMATKPADGLVLKNGQWVSWVADMSVPFQQILRYLTAQHVRPNSARRIASTLTGYTPPSTNYANH